MPATLSMLSISRTQGRCPGRAEDDAVGADVLDIRRAIVLSPAGVDELEVADVEYDLPGRVESRRRELPEQVSIGHIELAAQGEAGVDARRSEGHPSSSPEVQARRTLRQTLGLHAAPGLGDPRG